MAGTVLGAVAGRTLVAPADNEFAHAVGSAHNMADCSGCLAELVAGEPAQVILQVGVRPGGGWSSHS